MMHQPTGLTAIAYGIVVLAVILPLLIESIPLVYTLPIGAVLAVILLAIDNIG